MTVSCLSQKEKLSLQAEVHSKRDVTIASVRIKALCSEIYVHQANVTAVHSLESNPGTRTVQISLCDQILEALEELLKDNTLN